MCSLVCQQNRCEFITGRLRAVQRANAHYYIDAGLTPPYTQQSIKSPGRWRKSIGPEPPGIGRGQREREWKEARKKKLKKKSVLEGTRAWLTQIRAQTFEQFQLVIN